MTILPKNLDIRWVCFALGGHKLRGNRGQAFWRDGSGYNVALDPEQGVWFDHRDGVGGDVVTLVRTVRQCGFRDAVDWLAHFAGMPVPGKAHDHREAVDTDWPTDLKWATWWKISAEAFCEDALAQLPPWHHERRELTRLLSTIRMGDAALVHEYRAWRRRHPLITAGLARAGRLSDARVQRLLAEWIVRNYGETTS